MRFKPGRRSCVTGVETTATQAIPVAPVLSGGAVCSRVSLCARRSATEAREGCEATQLAWVPVAVLCCAQLAASEVLLPPFLAKCTATLLVVHMKWYTSE